MRSAPQGGAQRVVDKQNLLKDFPTGGFALLGDTGEAVSSLLVYRSYHEGPYASESVLKYWSYGELWHIAFGMAAFLSLSSGVALY